MPSAIVQLLSSKKIAAIISKVTSAGLSFVFLWLIARTLNVSDAGVYLYSYAVMSVLVQIARAGSEHYVVSQAEAYVSEKEFRKALFVLMHVVFLVASFFGVSMLLIVELGFLEAYTESTKYVYYIFLVGAVLFAFCQLFSSFFQSRQWIYSQYWGLNVGVALLSVLSYGAFYLSGETLSLKFASWIFVCTCFWVLLTCFAILKSKGVFSSGRLIFELMEVFEVKAGELRATFAAVLPFFVVTLVSIVIQWGGQILSGVWLEASELGLLSVSQRIAFLVGFVFLAFSNLMAPVIARMYSKDGDVNLKVVSSYSAISNAYALVMFFVLWFWGREILMLFGAHYVGGYECLVIIAFSMLFSTLAGPCSTIMLMCGYVEVLRRNLIVSGVISVIFSVFLISNMGLVGAAYAIGASTCFVAILNNLSLRKSKFVSVAGVQDFKNQGLSIFELFNRVRSLRAL